MALPNPSFFLGLVFVFYFSSFIIFGVIRAVTGISIQRIGFSGLRRIAYTPKDGIKLEIRGLGINVHRPTFAQPTWLSLVLTELRLTVDLDALSAGVDEIPPTHEEKPNGQYLNAEDLSRSPRKDGKSSKLGAGRSKKPEIWMRLINVKDKIKKLHRNLGWLKMFDLVFQRSSLVIVGVGTVDIGSVSAAVDTRPTTVDRSRLFQHNRTDLAEQRPAEWTFATRSILFTPEGKEAGEILDHAVLNIHGFLDSKLEGLRDASLALKLGRVHIPYDDFLDGLVRAKAFRRHKEPQRKPSITDNKLSSQETEAAQHEKVLTSLTEAQGFVASVLRGIREVSIATSFVGISKRVDFVQPAGKPIFINMSMKELGFDVYRLDKSTPAHSMYFPRNDTAHQALLSALSISVGVDDGQAHPERLLYVPMTTATVRTTLPSKIFQYADQRGALDLNSNVLFANLVITSPSIDVDPGHLPLLLGITQNQRQSSKSENSHSHPFISELLPKLNVKLSIHEPVIRVALPAVQRLPDDYNFDLLISAISTIQLDVEASHSTTNQLRYAVISTLRIASHRLYYQAAGRETHDLLIIDSVDVKSQVTAAPDLAVVASVKVQTMSTFMIRSEISNGVRQIIKQLRSDVASDKVRQPHRSGKSNVLRKIPVWLQRFDLHASDFNVELAGVDEHLSTQSRGVALHLDEISSEYRAKKDEHIPRAVARRRTGSQSLVLDESLLKSSSPLSRAQKNVKSLTDGRRLTLHLKGFESTVIESLNVLEQKPFLIVPQSEVALTTSSDAQSSILHVNSLVKGIYLEYSLFRHYAIGVAFHVIRRTFDPVQKNPQTPSPAQSQPISSAEGQESSTTSNRVSEELLSVDLKVPFIQIKAAMPSDPYIMIHFEGIEAGRHRWATPFVKAAVARLYAESPAMPQTWSRIFSVKNFRLDLRESRKVINKESRDDSSIDVAAEAIRIGIPHQLVVHHIFDNFVNTAKTVAQLHHRFKTETEEYILAKHPEGPKHVPKITLRSHILVFDLEDGAFEWKLGVIYRTGIVEQKQRLARAEAFRIKCKKLQASEPVKNTPAGLRSRSRDQRRSRSYERYADRQAHGISSVRAESRKRSSSASDMRGRGTRYDAEGVCEMSSSTQTTISEAAEKLKIFNSQSWKKRIDSALAYQTGAVEDVRNLLWGLDQAPNEIYHYETILKMPQRPALMSLLMSNLSVVIEKPTFPMSDLPDFLHRIGKGLPRDTKFGLLIPLHAHFEMGETRMSLRDYPLPLLHIPATKKGQSSRLSSWSFKTNFVIGEEFRDSKSTRDLQIMVIPPEKMDPEQKSRGFAIDVRRTVSPVKMYSDMNVEIHTARDTRITWGTSYQPAIQDMMQVIEGFTKPQIDPSEKVGFWDKIRLSFHSKISVNWVGDGDVHLMLKGSRDPYVVTGHGTGLVMIWRNKVQWNIWQEDDPARFMTVDSGDYILAVPDFSHYARQSSGMEISHAQDSSISAGPTDGQVLKKVVMKLSGKVRWKAGLVFERNLENGGRSFDFIPHYEVTLKNPQHVKSIKNEKAYDAFRGFRSNHMHLSIAVSAPSDRDWSLKNLACSSNYNSVHLTPRFFTHFFAWWSLFSGVMSLPVRQGALFPGVEKSGKKFGRHIATIKYNLLLSPLFISHIYKHKEAEEFTNESASATGLKMRLDSFMLDLHQRREEFNSEVKGLNKVVKTTGIRINQALLDLVRADMRALSSTILGTTIDDVREADNNPSHPLTSDPVKVDLSSFTIPDNDFKWVDADDLVEIDWTLPVGSVPDTKILPLAFSPRFTYRRQTDHHETISGDPDRHSPFGYESTHDCIMSSDDDPVRVQLYLIQKRLDRVDELMKMQATVEGEQELRVMREIQDETTEKSRLDELRGHGDILKKKKTFLLEMLKNLTARLAANGGQHSFVQENEEDSKRRDSRHTDKFGSSSGHEDEMDPSNMSDLVSDFNNRFVVHNAQIKWNNSLRNVMLRYLYQVRQRRGFVYYTSRRAVKFILDIIEEQNKAKRQSPSPESQAFGGADSPQFTTDDNSEMDVQARIQQLLDDGNKFVDADDPASADGGRKFRAANKATDEVSHGYMAQNTYHLRLVAPQIQLQSEKNAKAVVLVTARGMRLKVVQIMDKDRLSDDVSGLVQTRYSTEMDNVQFFVTTKELLSPDFLKLYAGAPYGTAAGSTWPPWAPVEAMFDFDVHPYGFARVVQRTSASLRYDKYNQLRLKYNDDVTAQDSRQKALHAEDSGDQMDHLWVDFPRIRAICDSSQYYAIYIIVLDLLMWSEPLEKTRHERLEKIMLASDFSDLRGTPEMVEMLQERIRQLNEIKTHFHINEKYLDVHGWEDRISLEQDLASCEDELFFMMKAITTAQRKADERTEGSQTNGILRWYLSAAEIVWHLRKEENVPLAEFQLGNAVYERTDNSDGSNYNCVEVDRIEGLSLLPTAIYPEIIGPYSEHIGSTSKSANIQMLRVNWLKLEAIAGINVVDRFEVNLFPLRIQLDYETGRKLFDYIFPGGSGSDEGFSPFLVRQKLPLTDEENEEEDTETSRARREAIAQAKNTEKQGQATGAGSLDARLQPTHRLPQKMSPPSMKSRLSGLGINGGDGHRFKLTLHPNDSKSSLDNSQKKLNNRMSVDNISTTSRGRETSGKPTSTTTNGSHDGEKRKLGFLHRSHRSSSADSKKNKEKESGDDLTQMLNRASNYMTLAYVKIPSVALCLSYKGKGNRNFEDVHDLVFRMPTVEYRNKTWSNLDLALALKKDVIRALISHTGAIIGNKFIHHKPAKYRRSRLREIASSSSVMSGTEYGFHTGRASGSTEFSRAQSATSSIIEEDNDDNDDDDDENEAERSRHLSVVTDEASDDESPKQSNSSSRSQSIVERETGNRSRVHSGAGLHGNHGAETLKSDPVRNKLRRNLSELKGMVMDRVGNHSEEQEEHKEQSTPKKSALKKIFASLDRI